MGFAVTWRGDPARCLDRAETTRRNRCQKSRKMPSRCHHPT